MNLTIEQKNNIYDFISNNRYKFIYKKSVVINFLN